MSQSYFKRHVQLHSEVPYIKHPPYIVARAPCCPCFCPAAEPGSCPVPTVSAPGPFQGRSPAVLQAAALLGTFIPSAKQKGVQNLLAAQELCLILCPDVCRITGMG